MDLKAALDLTQSESSSSDSEANEPTSASPEGEAQRVPSFRHSEGPGECPVLLSFIFLSNLSDSCYLVNMVERSLK